ncbi:MAG: transcriptional repressor [Candidatus Contendobacter sp.]|jgi:Fur family zinc uptake transcriptional regulator|nr:transcriptional repressor [Gammaproteobacteria bacterium]MCC8992346.1 transcriptional repressor [Candidatus Contendobacter sp.]
MTPLSNVADPVLSPAQDALAQAEAMCQQRGSRLTDLRRRVLEILWNNLTPMGAYAILDVLRDDGRPGAPPTVYRALDFLLEQGLIHRLASLNVFTVCRQPGRQHGGQFLICRDCGQVDELSNATVENLLRIEAETRDFEVLAQMVEILGRCPDCRQGATAHGG